MERGVSRRQASTASRARTVLIWATVLRVQAPSGKAASERSSGQAYSSAGRGTAPASRSETQPSETSVRHAAGPSA